MQARVRETGKLRYGAAAAAVTPIFLPSFLPANPSAFFLLAIRNRCTTLATAAAAAAAGNSRGVMCYGISLIDLRLES